MHAASVMVISLISLGLCHGSKAQPKELYKGSPILKGKAVEAAMRGW